MIYKKHKLGNGIRVIVVPVPSLESATVTVWAGVGSRFEEPKIAGISHFLEHMVFKGSSKRPSAKEIAEAVDAIGGEFNAGTSKEWTNFYIKSRAGNLDTAFDVLSDMVLKPLLKEEDINRERGVIIEEIGMYEDTPMYRIGDIFEQVIFKGNSLGRDIIGSKETVSAIKKSDFEGYRNIYYYPENLVITVAGGVKEKEVVKLVQKYFGELSKGKAKPGFDKFKLAQVGPQVRLHPQKKEQAHFILGFLTAHMDHEDRFVEAVLAAILGGGMSSRLFTEVREKRGLAYSVRTSTDHARDIGYIGTYAGVAPKKVEEAIAVVLEQHYKIANGELRVMNNELRKAKEYLKGHLALSLEDTKDINKFFGEEELLLGKVETPEEVYQGVDKVSLGDVQRVAKKYFVPDRLNLAVIGPYDSQEKFEKLVK